MKPLELKKSRKLSDIWEDEKEEVKQKVDTPQKPRVVKENWDAPRPKEQF